PLIVHVHLVAVTMPLLDRRVVIDLRDAAAGLELRRISAEAHRAAQLARCITALDDIAARPLRQQSDHGVLARPEFGGAGALQAHQFPCSLDYRHLHAEADAEIGNVVLAGEAGRLDLAGRAALAEAAGHENAVDPLQPLDGSL